MLYLAGINAKVYVCTHLVPHTDVADAAYIVKTQYFQNNVDVEWFLEFGVDIVYALSCALLILSKAQVTKLLGFI